MTSSPRRILWVWTPRELNHTRKTKELLEFCQKESITHIYYQVILKEEEYPKISAEIEGKEFFRDFLREAHEVGVSVFALLSPGQFFGKKGRAKVQAEVKAIQEFNAGSQDEEVFDGVHFSFDLHFSEGSKTRDMQTKVLEFLQLLRRVKIDLHIHRPHMIFGVDLPFWFLTGKRGPIPRMIFSLRVKEAGQHLLDIVDEAVVFPYRTAFIGDSGIQARVAPAIAYAGKCNKKVFIGLETMPLSTADASFASLGKAGLKKVEFDIHAAFDRLSGFGGIGIHDHENYRKLK